MLDSRLRCIPNLRRDPRLAKRRSFTDQSKAKLALEALRGDKTVQEIAAKHQLHPNQVSTWKRQAIEGMVDVFSGGKQRGPTEDEVKELHAKIGKLAVVKYDARGLLSGRPKRGYRQTRPA